MASEVPSFELFHALSESVHASGGQRPPHDWPTLSRQILAMNQEGLETILALVLYYASQEKKGKSTGMQSIVGSAILAPSAKLPFKSKTFVGGLGFVVDIENLPSKLQDIIALFVDIVSRSTN